jgi:hypothetical protein
MKLPFLLLSFFWFWVAVGFGQETMTPELFRQIVATPGDVLPLPSQITSASPIWTNATASVVMKYQTGKVFTETIKVTAKTVGGKYVVFTALSQFYKQPISSILTYDAKAAAVKTYALYGDTLTFSTSVIDYDKKIYAENSTYGDGFNEITVGSYSDTEESERTIVYHNGGFSMTREVKTYPSQPGGL